MKNRNNEIEIAPEMEFDYDEFDEEQRNIPVEVHENPYEDYEVWDVEITETVTKKIAIFAKDPESAQEYTEELLDKIDLSHDIDQYEKKAEVKGNDGSTCFDYTVPLWWYEKDEDEDE